MPFFWPKLSIPDVDFKGKTAVVTGTTNGLGLAVSHELLKRRIDRLIMGVRSLSKGEAVKAQLLSDPAILKSNPNAQIYVLHLDLDDYRSVIAFADSVKKLPAQIDILLLNAGLGGTEWSTSPSGHEKILQANVLSNALLSLELLPQLEETATIKGTPSRLTWVGSFVQENNSLTTSPVGAGESVLAHFDDKSKFNGMARYPDSKLLSTLFVHELAKRVDSKKVIVNDVSPGMVATNFGSTYPFIIRVFFAIMMMLRARSVDEGAKTYLYAIGIAGEESHGQYLAENNIETRAAFTEPSNSKTVQERLWEEVLVNCLSEDPSLKALHLAA